MKIAKGTRTIVYLLKKFWMPSMKETCTISLSMYIYMYMQNVMLLYYRKVGNFRQGEIFAYFATKLEW